MRNRNVCDVCDGVDGPFEYIVTFGIMAGDWKLCRIHFHEKMDEMLPRLESMECSVRDTEYKLIARIRSIEETYK